MQAKAGSQGEVPRLKNKGLQVVRECL